MTIVLSVTTAIVLGLCSWTTVHAFDPQRLSLEQKVLKSTYVFMGTVKIIEYHDGRAAGNESLALVSVDQALKGSVSGDVEVIYRNGMPELDTNCCIAGGRYLFFVVRDKRGLLASVGGAGGIYSIDAKSRVKEIKVAGDN